MHAELSRVTLNPHHSTTFVFNKPMSINRGIMIANMIFLWHVSTIFVLLFQCHITTDDHMEKTCSPSSFRSKKHTLHCDATRGGFDIKYEVSEVNYVASHETNRFFRRMREKTVGRKSVFLFFFVCSVHLCLIWWDVLD